VNNVPIQFDEQQKINLRLKRLDAIQAIIARIAGNCATAKNIAITIAMALTGLGTTAKAPSALLVGMLATMVIACLDARYLSLERRYREFHNEICATPWDDDPDMSVDIAKAPSASWCESLRSWSILGVYGLLLTIELVFLIALLGTRYCDV